MNADPSDSNSHPTVSFLNFDSQVHLKIEGDKVIITLPPTESKTTVTDWLEIWESLQSRVNGKEKSWSNGTPVHLVAKDCLLDARQLQMIEETLQQAKLELKTVITSRRQTAVASVMAGYSVQQENPTKKLLISSEEEDDDIPSKNLVDPLYYEKTVRSGIEIRHSGTIIIMGDVNPGGVISSAMDIIVWGRLKGIAHAGAQGDRKCRIMALKMQPTQLRIADLIARPPETPLDYYEPEVAYMGKEGIGITPYENFNKTFSFSSLMNAWLEI